MPETPKTSKGVLVVVGIVAVAVVAVAAPSLTVALVLAVVIGLALWIVWGIGVRLNDRLMGRRGSRSGTRWRDR